MSLFDKFDQIAASRQALADRGITSNVVMEKVISSTEAVINGRRVILAGTNNYLGPHSIRIVSKPLQLPLRSKAPVRPGPEWPTAPILVM